MKQHLKIKTFYGKSQNAVYNQIWIALIIYCLQILIKIKAGDVGTLLEVKWTLQTFLFKPFNAFVRSLYRKPTRTSEGRKTYDFEAEFRIIQRQFDEGKVDHLDDLAYDPMFL